MCSKDELCPINGQPYNAIGVKGRPDTWVPVSDGLDEWLQFGQWANQQSRYSRCSLHSVQYAYPHPCHTYPDPTPHPDVAGCPYSQLYCCGCPANHKSKL